MQTQVKVLCLLLQHLQQAVVQNIFTAWQTPHGIELRKG
jgi:hypothetical protein